MSEIAQVVIAVFTGFSLLFASLSIPGQMTEWKYIKAGYKKVIVPGCMNTQWALPNVTEELAKTVNQ